MSAVVKCSVARYSLNEMATAKRQHGKHQSQHPTEHEEADVEEDDEDESDQEDENETRQEVAQGSASIKVIYGKTNAGIQNLQQLSDYCISTLTRQTLIFIQVLQTEVESYDNFFAERYKSARKVLGMRKFHSVQVMEKNLICRHFAQSTNVFEFPYASSVTQLLDFYNSGNFVAIVCAQNFVIGTVISN
jgi:hypothetical protein